MKVHLKHNKLKLNYKILETLLGKMHTYIKGKGSIISWDGMIYKLTKIKTLIRTNIKLWQTT